MFTPQRYKRPDRLLQYLRIETGSTVPKWILTRLKLHQRPQYVHNSGVHARQAIERRLISNASRITNLVN